MARLIEQNKGLQASPPACSGSCSCGCDKAQKEEPTSREETLRSIGRRVVTDNRQALDLLGEWDRSPWSEIGRNDSPERLNIPGPYPLSDRWLSFWLAVYRVRRWIKQGLAR